MLRVSSVFLAFVLAAQAASLPEVGSQQITSPDQVPQGLGRSDWADIRAAYEAGRHEFRLEADGSHLARNPGLAWKMRFDDCGFTVRPEGGGWEWGLELETEGALPDQKLSVLKRGANRLEARRSAAVTEWFVNDARGLEQGWTLTAPAQIRLRMRGGLKPDVSAQSVSFGGQITYSGLKAWDATGKIVPTSFESTAEGFAVRYDDRGARYPLTIDPIAQSALLRAGNEGIDDWFGWSVGVAGNIVVVGAPNEDGHQLNYSWNNSDNEGAVNAGAVYVFERREKRWFQDAYVKAPQITAGDRFGLSVAISETTMIVGAPLRDLKVPGINGVPDQEVKDAGVAYVFRRYVTGWILQASLKAAQISVGDNFGSSVSISGDTVVVGASSEDGSSPVVNGTVNEAVTDAGAAYVFLRTGTTLSPVWSQQAYLKARQVSEYDLFGSAVAVSGDTVVVGALGEDGTATGVNGVESEDLPYAGAAYVFVRNGAVWSHQAYLKPSHGGFRNYFGFSVAIYGDTLVVGEPEEDGSATGVNGIHDLTKASAGAAYVFVRDGGLWAQQAYLKAGEVSADDNFGHSVAIWEDTVLVGSPGEDGSATGVNGTVTNSASGRGAAYAFKRRGSTWSQELYLKAGQIGSQRAFGRSVAVSPEMFVAGAPHNAIYYWDPLGIGTVTVFGEYVTPVVAAVSPVWGRIEGGATMTITGSEFTGVSRVTIGGINAVSFGLVNDNTLVCVTPPQVTPGMASVEVTTPGGTNAANTLFKYVIPNVPPTFTLPASGGPSAGEIWTPRQSGAPTIDGLVSSGAPYRSWRPIASSADGTKLAAAMRGGRIYTSTDSGMTWTARESTSQEWSRITSSADGTRLAAAAYQGQIHTSTDSGLTWTARGPNHNWVSIASSADGMKLAAVASHTRDFYTSHRDGRLYTSDDAGVTWTARDVNRDWSSVASSADGTKLVAGEDYGYVYTSTDTGVTWTRRGPQESWKYLTSSADGTKLAATNNGWIYTSTDSGVSWNRQLGSMAAGLVVSSADGSRLVAAGADYKTYLSADFGVTWTASSANPFGWSFAWSADGSQLAGSFIGLLHTSRAVLHNISVMADHGPVSMDSFVTQISPGPPHESGQSVTLAITNDNEALFSTQPAIDASGRLTFTPRPTACGTAKVSVIAVDNGGTDYGGLDSSGSQLFTITLLADMRLSGNGVGITSGDFTPSLADHTDFGTVPLLHQQVTRRYTLVNSGIDALQLTGTPVVRITGDAAEDFKVISIPGTTLVSSGGSTFEIAFDPKMPGLRSALVSIASDDPAMPNFVYAISGTAGLDRRRRQTITFNPPASLYVQQSPFSLNASSTSGLPVTFRVLGGAGSLSENDLYLHAAGAARVEVTQAGNDLYAPAVPVLRTITLKNNPGSFDLINLVQMYDGKPKPVSTFSTSTVEFSYKVDGITGPDAPTAAGSYLVTCVQHGVKKTATLLITKAPLYVIPDDQRKFAGQPNPGLTYKITGFRGVDTEAVVTRLPVLKTTATTTSPGGEYVITGGGGEAQNYTLIYPPGTLVVESFAAGYEALLMDVARLPVGKLSLSVASSSTAFTASLYTSAESSPVPFAGSLITDPALEQASGSAMTMRSGLPYAIQFTLPLRGAFNTGVTYAGTALGSADDGQKRSAAKAGHAGAHTVVLEPALPAGPDVPGGAGWATAVISDKGVLTLAGKLGDGTGFTCAIAPDERIHPGYRLFVQPYLDPAPPASLSGSRPGTTPKFLPRPQSFMAGGFRLMPHPVVVGRRHVGASGMTWKKSGRGTDASYRGGFGPVTSVLMLDPWQKPAAAARGTPAVTLMQRLGLGLPNFAVAHSATGSSANASLPTRLALNAANAVSVHTPSVNLTKWKVATFNATNGTFTGSFELIDGALKRPVIFRGVLRQPTDSQDALIGDGHYLLPPMTGTEKSTGELNFQRP